MGKQSPALDRRKAKRLGVALKRLRVEREIPATRLAEMTGLSRSYLSYLENGRFAEIGLDKFTRITEAVQASPEALLREAGYLPKEQVEKIDPNLLLQGAFDLTPTEAQSAAAFIAFLKAEKTNRRRRNR